MNEFYKILSILDYEIEFNKNDEFDIIYHIKCKLDIDSTKQYLAEIRIYNDLTKSFNYNFTKNYNEDRFDLLFSLYYKYLNPVNGDDILPHAVYNIYYSDLIEYLTEAFQKEIRQHKINKLING